MTEWRIYYGDGSIVRGRTRAEWVAAPDQDVQVVVLMETPPPEARPWSGVTDRKLWTGQDSYALSGWPSKAGAWVDRAWYDLIWERARGDD